MEQERASAFQGGGRDAQRSTASKHCSFLRPVGGAVATGTKGHCPGYRANDLRNSQNVSNDQVQINMFSHN